MKFKLWREYGALNSRPIFDAFEHSCVSNGHSLNSSNNINDSDVHVIWSVLFNGRMSGNKHIWNSCQSRSKQIIVLEVGSIKRGITWKVGINGINRDGNFGPMGNNSDRANSLGLSLKPWRSKGDHILICGQHEKSLQWENMPKMNQWVSSIIEEIKSHTDKAIVFRPHPRCFVDGLENKYENVYIDTPQKINGTYDDFNLSFKDCYAVINWSSNPGIQAIISGIPAFTGPSSLAWPVANTGLETITNPKKPERQQWLNDYAWTEYTIEEISQGIPLKRLTNSL